MNQSFYVKPTAETLSVPIFLPKKRPIHLVVIEKISTFAHIITKRHHDKEAYHSDL